MQRITEKDLEAVVKRLNVITNSPQEPYAKQNGEIVAQVGNYHLDHAYGGVALHLMVDGGGESDVLNSGHVSRRELYGLIHAYIKGIMLCRQ